MRKKVAIYTAVTKDSLLLYDPAVISEYCDYICFTDDSRLQSLVWQMRPFPENGLDSYRKEKQVKALPHLLLPEYDYTIWIDAAIEINHSIDQLIEEHLFNNEFDLSAFGHPHSDSVYTEAKAIIERELDRKETVALQMKHYHEQHYLDHGGLNKTSILFRKTHSPELISIMNQWWEEIATYSFIDQLSFNYIAWKNQFTVGTLTEPPSSSPLFFHHNEQHLVS